MEKPNSFRWTASQTGLLVIAVFLSEFFVPAYRWAGTAAFWLLADQFMDLRLERRAPSTKQHGEESIVATMTKSTFMTLAVMAVATWISNGLSVPGPHDSTDMQARLAILHGMGTILFVLIVLWAWSNAPLARWSIAKAPNLWWRRT